MATEMCLDETYFFLNPECYLVVGSLRGAIYNLHTGDLFSIDEQLTSVLERCEKRIPLSELSKDYDNIDIITVLRQLEALNLGTFYKNRPLIEKLKPAILKRQKREQNIPRRLEHLTIELTSDCNLDCAFCEKESYEARKRIGCDRWPTGDEDKLNIEQWLYILSDTAKVECRSLCVVGGEPLLEKSMLFEILDSALSLRYQDIQLNTNSLLFDDIDIKFLSHYNICIMMQVYSHDPEIHDRITGVRGSFEQMMCVLHKMKTAGVIFGFNVVILKDNQSHWNESVYFFQSLEPKTVKYDILRPSVIGRNDYIADQMLYKLYYLRKEDKFREKILSDAFFQRCEGHSCWEGKLAIGVTGKVFPCIMERNYIIGNIKSKSLREMIRDKDMDKFWDMSKDEIDVCNCCEYRYACFDCRPVERCTEDIKSKNKYCTYNPLTGEWMSSEMFSI